MPSTRPWSPHPPVWEWEGILGLLREQYLEDFEERAAIIAYCSKEYRGVAEIRAYCLLIDRIHEEGGFTTTHMQDMDFIRQLGRAERFRRHDAIGRRIMAGTWPKRKGIERTNYLTTEEISA